jgi:hypothetical protein
MPKSTRVVKRRRNMMRVPASHFLALFFAMQTVALYAQTIEKPEPTFVLSIGEDKEAVRTNPGLHRVLVKYTRISFGFEDEKYHEEAMGMYQMVVLRNGAPVAETDAMRDLTAYRKADDNPTIMDPRLLKTGESWITPLDVSDYYDMTSPGTYQITVTRESLPGNPDFSVPVSSNSVTIVVSQEEGRPSAEPAEKPKPRFALAISAEDPDDVPPNNLRVELHNSTSGVIRERKCWPFIGMYNLVVFRDGRPIEGNDVLRRLQMTRTAVICPGNETLKEIKPGAFYADRVPLRNFYDVDEPGSYRVYVTRETYSWNPAKSVLVESNTISFVVPKPPPQPANDAPPVVINQPTQSPQ